MIWYLVIFYVLGTEGGVAIETIEFPSREACLMAEQVIEKSEVGYWSHVQAVCVSREGESE